MLHVSDISMYKRVATLNKNQKNGIDVYVATLHNKSSSEFYIINSFEHSSENQKIFQDFFFFYNDNNIIDFVNFLTDGNRFFVIFKYENNNGISYIFNKEKNIYNYKERCAILKDILIKISSISQMPVQALICATELNNIKIDNNKNVQIVYNFENYNNYIRNDTGIIYENIANIISVMLNQELEESKIPINSLYNKPLKIVIEKCKKHIYNSIPELILDLEKAEQACDKNDVKSAAYNYLNKKKEYLKRFSWIALSFMICFIIFFTFKPLFRNKNKPSSEPANIGAITYNKAAEAIDNNVDIQHPSNANSNSIDFSSIVIPANSDILYNEYIVQYGDTLDSICKSYYSNENLSSAVKTFNNISDDAVLQAGTILKLPAQSAISKFVEGYTY